MATEYTVSNAATYLTAMNAHVAGDTITLTADVSAVSAKTLRGTLDLGGHTLTLSGSDLHGLYVVGGAEIKNGTIQGSPYMIWNWNGGRGFTFTDLYIRDCILAIKLNSANTNDDDIYAEDITLTRVDIAITGGRGFSILDFGPGRCRDITLTDVKTYRPMGGNNTAGDILAVENGYGNISITRFSGSGSGGDGIDLKHRGPTCSLTDVYIDNCTRNAAKFWNLGGGTLALQDVTTYNCGMGTVFVHGVATVTDCYFEGGTLGSFAVEVEYETNATFTDCAFMRRLASAQLIAVWESATATWTDCTFYSEPHPHLHVGNPYVSTAAAKAGTWPSSWTNPTYAYVAVGDYTPTAPTVPGGTSPVDPPIVTPPTYTATAVSNVSATGFTVTVGMVGYSVGHTLTVWRTSDAVAVYGPVDVTYGQVVPITGLAEQTTYRVVVSHYTSTYDEAVTVTTPATGGIVIVVDPGTIEPGIYNPYAPVPTVFTKTGLARLFDPEQADADWTYGLPSVVRHGTLIRPLRLHARFAGGSVTLDAETDERETKAAKALSTSAPVYFLPADAGERVDLTLKGTGGTEVKSVAFDAATRRM